MSLKLFYENVTLLDYAFWDSSVGPKGNSLRVNIELSGVTDQDGIISDFSITKKKIKEIIDQYVDHKFIIPKKLATENNNEVIIETLVDNEELYYRAPKEAVCILDTDKICDNTISLYLEKVILEKMPDSISSIKVILEDVKGIDDKYFFHYTHGLKHHYGNCQRLLHGHKNPVRIWVNGTRNNDIEKYLASEVFKGTVHFAFRENVVNIEEVDKQSIVCGPLDKIKIVHLKYTSAQGLYEIKIPGKWVNLVNIETSVENLSKYFYEIIAHKCEQNDQIMVQAFEGIGKGAIYTGK